MIQRVDQLDSPPTAGKFYLVPAIFWNWGQCGGPSSWWPVIGPKHHDLEFFNFKEKHYHVDPRFLTRRHKVHLHPSKWGSPEQTVLG
jgi:hypothetical protein